MGPDDQTQNGMPQTPPSGDGAGDTNTNVPQQPVDQGGVAPTGDQPTTPSVGGEAPEQGGLPGQEQVPGVQPPAADGEQAPDQQLPGQQPPVAPGV